MSIFSSWWLYLSLYLIFALIFTQFYKVSTKRMRSAAALTILIQLIAGVSALSFSLFFEYKFSTDCRVYLLLGLAAIFYAITDRVNTVTRSGIEASTFSILSQISTVFLIIAGILFFKEPVLLPKVIGSILIVFSNVLVFYKKGAFTFDKYILFGILGNITITIAMLLDINLSENFNLPFYVTLTFLIPAFILIIFERIKFSELKKEFLVLNKKSLVITSVSWMFMVVSLLKTYQLGDVTVVAPLSSLIVILNVIAGYIFLKERDNLSKKIIASILIIVSVFLINL